MHVDGRLRRPRLGPKKVKIPISCWSPGAEKTFNHRGNLKYPLHKSNQIAAAVLDGSVGETGPIYRQ